MPNTKKLLVAFNPAKPEAQSSDFLIPWNKDGRLVFLGLKSKKDFSHGMMVYVGRTITENDIFAKLVDSGAYIENVEETMACLGSFVTQLQSLKIGNVVQLVSGDPASASLFGLELVAQTPSGFKK